MHPADITAALKKRGSSQAIVARRLKITKTSVYQVVHGHQASRRVSRAISEITGIPISQLWPGRYPAEEAIEKTLKRAA